MTSLAGQTVLDTAPTFVSWGTYEILAGEDEEFAARVKDAGIDTAFLAVPGGQHSYVYGAAQIAAWVPEKLNITTTRRSEA